MSTEALRRIEEIKARAMKATAGPWDYWDRPDNDLIVAKKKKDAGMPIFALAQLASRPEDFKFVAAARTDVPALCQALEIALRVLGDYRNAPRLSAHNGLADKAIAQIEEVLK